MSGSFLTPYFFSPFWHLLHSQILHSYYSLFLFFLWKKYSCGTGMWCLFKSQPEICSRIWAWAGLARQILVVNWSPASRPSRRCAQSPWPSEKSAPEDWNYRKLQAYWASIQKTTTAIDFKGSLTFLLKILWRNTHQSHKRGRLHSKRG